MFLLRFYLLIKFVLRKMRRTVVDFIPWAADSAWPTEFKEPIQMRTPFNPIITSLLAQDAYKLSMLQTMLHRMPGNHAEYRFVCRNTPEFPLTELADEVNEQLDHLCTLRYQGVELEWLGALRHMKSDFIEFLRLFQFQRRFITVTIEGDELVIWARGPQVHVMGFEIFTLAIVNELYFRRLVPTGELEATLAEGRVRLAEKIRLLKTYGQSLQGMTRKHPLEFFDFGLRRRFSGAWQEEVVTTLSAQVPEFFKGTSNMDLARRHKLVPIGTMAHEYMQTFQAMPGVQLRESQKAALEAWVQEYRGDLGTALTDVIGMDAFCRDLDLYFAKLFDGLRHDSGNPVVWGEKALSHYAQLRIDAHSKRLVWSDGLDVPKAIELHGIFADRVQTGFGIGTNLTNDLGPRPLNIVMKLIRCNGQPTAKLSDSTGKTLSDDPVFVGYLRQVFNHPESATA